MFKNKSLVFFLFLLLISYLHGENGNIVLEIKSKNNELARISLMNAVAKKMNPKINFSSEKSKFISSFVDLNVQYLKNDIYQGRFNQKKLEKILEVRSQSIKNNLSFLKLLINATSYNYTKNLEAKVTYYNSIYKGLILAQLLNKQNEILLKKAEMQALENQIKTQIKNLKVILVNKVQSKNKIELTFKITYNKDALPNTQLGLFYDSKFYQLFTDKKGEAKIKFNLLRKQKIPLVAFYPFQELKSLNKTHFKKFSQKKNNLKILIENNEPFKNISVVLSKEIKSLNLYVQKKFLKDLKRNFKSYGYLINVNDTGSYRIDAQINKDVNVMMQQKSLEFMCFNTIFLRKENFSVNFPTIETYAFQWQKAVDQSFISFEFSESVIREFLRNIIDE